MPITLPDLDNREFADLVAEAKSMIPRLAPSWTDHNPSDPGITLIELFAYICEILIYRTNRITDANKRVFLELLMSEDWLKANVNQSLDRQIAIAIAELRQEERAISNEDFEKYALTVDGVARAYCRALRNYEAEASKLYETATAHVSLVIVAKEKPFDTGLIITQLAQQVTDVLQKRKLLTTQLHVVPASYLQLGVKLSLVILDGFKETEIEKKAFEKLESFFHPLYGGVDGKGWELGQPVYIADIYALLDQLQGVDYIEGKPILTLDQGASPLPEERIITAYDTTDTVGIRLNENELLQFNRDWSSLTVKIPRN
jgi:hypothetical protein